MRTLHNIQKIVLIVSCSLIVMIQTGHPAMRQMRLEETARQANTIVLGAVVRQESAWDARHTAIHTDVTVAVERAIVGSPGAEVTFRVAGGIVGSMGMRTSNDPVFRDGERVIVFLDTTAVPASVVGMQQGKVTVQDDMVMGAGEPLPLEDFIATIRTAMR